MTQDDPIHRSISAMGTYFVGDSSVGEALDKICRAVIDEIEPARYAGISMTVDARIGTYVFSHPEAQQIDQAQYDTGDGPCIDAFRTGDVVSIPSTIADGPYPESRRAAVEHGMLSVMSVPLSTGMQVVGALNLYAAEEHGFDERGTAEAIAAFASHAAFVLLNHQAYWDARSLSENLNQAMISRSEIEQAKGIIMASTGCSPEEAFDRLRAQSQAENVKLRDIAAELVRRAQRPH